MNFLDPALDSEGNPYGPTRYRQIVKERFLISKHCNTSYNDVGEMTPTERIYLLQLISEDLERTRELSEKAKEGRN